MRRLLYVPIIHEEADMGSVGAVLARKTAALSGERRWAIHKETVAKFWQSVAAYVRSFDPCRMKVYQDGWVADGNVGRRIVEEAAGRGSRNYQLILDLIDRGAEVRKTEDAVLLLRERENILGLAQEQSPGKHRRNSLQARGRKDRLTEERDRFIAHTINTTLQDGEIGLLLIGAHHDVASRLPEDISVTAVKEPEQVMAYFEELLHGQDEKRLAALAENLTSPVILS